MNKSKFTIDIEILKENKLTLEAYLVLYCLKTNDEKLLSYYITSCKKISTEVFEKLKNDGFITYETKEDGVIYFKLLSLTLKGNMLALCPDTTSSEKDSQFEEFRKHYPSSVKVPGKKVPRRLHSDLARCRKLYANLMMETTHEILCKAADLYYQEKQQLGTTHFMQDLGSWLHQKNYQQYLEDIEKNTNFTTQTNFQDDI